MPVVHHYTVTETRTVTIRAESAFLALEAAKDAFSGVVPPASRGVVTSPLATVEIDAKQERTWVL